MALSGNLSNFRLGDLLQTLAQNRQWGVLRLRRGTETRQLSISERGLAHLDLTGIARKRIEERLHHQGYLDRATVEKFRKPECAKRPLKDLLKEIQGFEASALSSILQDEAAEQIHALLDWTSGEFELVETPASPDKEDTPPLDVNAVILDGARRMDERGAMGERAPHASERFVALEAAVLQSLGEDQAAILAGADGNASLRAIADRTVGDLFAAMKIALELEDAGLVRRLTLEELLANAEAATQSKDAETAKSVLDLVERTRPLETDDEWIDLAARWRAISENGRAAGSLLTLAQRLSEQGDPARSAVVLREAIALAPRVLRIRHAYLEAVRAQPDADATTLYEALRDYLLLCADRGNAAGAGEIEAEILQQVPNDPDELARVGRALGRVGRAATAADLLCRAGKVRHRAKKGDREALECFRDALSLDPNHVESRRGVEELSGRRSVRRRTAAAIAAALTAVVGLAAVPLWCRSAAQRDVVAKLARAEAFLASGDLAKAADEMRGIDPAIPSTELRARADEIRAKLPSDLLERASSQPRDEESWLNERFTAASDRLEAQDYPGAFELYDSILEKRDDEKRRDLITHRLQTIERRLRAEPRRVHELTRALTPGAKETAISPSKARAELEGLLDAARREHIAAIGGALETSAAAKLLTESEQASLRDAVKVSLEALDQSWKTYEPMRQQQSELSRFVELEPLLIEARRAEADSDARAAVRAFASLRERYPGQVLKSYLEERCTFWNGVVEHLDAYDRAVTAGDTATARQEIEEIRSKYPEVNVAASGLLPVEIRTTPKGATVSFDGEPLGASPVVLRPKPGVSGKLRAEMPGFEAAESTLPTTPVGRIELTLSRKPSWSFRMEGSISAPGCLVRDRWIVGDRRGNVRAFHPATGAAAWSRRFETLGGIAGAPQCDGTRVFVQTVEGQIYALDPADGKTLFQSDLKETITLGLGVGDAGCAVVTAKDRLYLRPTDSSALVRAEPMFARATTPPCALAKGFALGTSDGSVLAYDAGGRLRWRALRGESVSYLVAETSTWLVIAGARISRLDAATGATLDEVTLTSSPVAPPSISSRDSYWIPIAGQILEIDRKTLDRRSALDLASLVPNQLVPFADGFVAACAPGALRFDAAGTLRWARVGSGRGHVTMLSDSVLGVVFEDGEVVALPIDR